MSKINRRKFLASSFLTAASLSIPVKSWANVKGANDRIRVATVGFRSRGGAHINGMKALAPEGVDMVALCDVDQGVLDKGLASFERDGKKVQGFRDIRQMLEMKDLDAITVATPNHWHALQAIWAIQAGKDVYLEKPVSHNVWEGRKVVEAARKYGKIVQTGTQSRSSTGIKHAVEWVQAGNLGKIKVAYGLCYKPRTDIGNVGGKAQAVPASIDYDLWCGPAPLVPPTRNGKFGPIHYDWHWLWDYGCGDLGNQGIHQMDIARWFLGEQHLAPRVWSLGERLGYEDDAETPNTQIVYQDYDAAPLIFEVRGLPKDKASRGEGGAWSKNMDKYKGASIGVVVECEGGYVSVPNYTGATAHDHDGKKIEEFKGAVDHFENFINAVRSRKTEDLHADIWEGHISSALCHTGNISYRLGKHLAPDAIKEKMKGQRGAEDSFGRLEEHLKANEIDIAKDKLILGEFLAMDPKVEKFIGNTDADKLLTREYRRPYVVPAEV